MYIELFITLAVFLLYLFLAHYVSYYLEKKRILNHKKWDLNICCGKTDGGGLNVDIFQHQNLPNFQKIDNIYNLPFEDKQFDNVLCSHTIEHVDDPEQFNKELQRVGNKVTLVVPPLYDLAAVFNIFEHKWIFLTFKKRHNSLPPYIKLPLAHSTHRVMGQQNNA